MPPAGNQPVRAATKTNASDVSSGGSETQTSETLRTSIGSGPERLPVKMPSESPTTVAVRSDDDAEQRGVRGRASHERRDRPVVEKGVAEIEAHRATDPQPPL